MPTGNMKKFYFFIFGCFSFLVTIYAANPACLEKEKSVALLKTVENFLSKAKETFPICKEVLNPLDESECGSLSYIELSKKIITDIRINFPTCTRLRKYDKPKDCNQVLANGNNESGIYTIWTGDSFLTGKQLQVYCDMETDNGGWTLIQRRGKFPVQQDFYQDWETYKIGFGNLTEEFWLGNENIRVLCLDGCKIRFDLVDAKGEKGFALYQNFKLAEDNYRIYISNFSGNVGNAMRHHAEMDFSAKDKGDIYRATTHKGGWWYFNNDYYVNLNGIYKPGESNHECILWWTWRNKANLDSVEIKVQRK